MKIKVFESTNWRSVEKEYNEFSSSVEILSMTCHVDQSTGLLKLLAMYKEQSGTSKRTQ